MSAYRRRIGACVLLMLAASATAARAQLNTQHLKGSAGLKAGSQPPPHIYVVAPLVYVYQTDTVRTNDGSKLPIDASISSVAYGAGLFQVTTKKILGGFYGYQILFPVGANNRIQGTEIDQNPGAGLTDSVVQPLNLGWHFKRADAMATYTIYLPTGRYSDGAANNTGFGMWGNEVSFGTTVYLNAKKQYHAGTQASISFQSKKEDSETKVGTNLVLEGGIGGDFKEGRISAGLAYNSGIKLTEDKIDFLPERLGPEKARSLALGPEATFVLMSKGRILGFIKLNYEWEVFAKNTTQGRNFLVAATFPWPAIRLPGQ